METFYEPCLKYVNTDVEYHVYDTGMVDYVDIDNIYADATLRGKVVAKIDLFDCLSDVYSKATVENYRDTILYILTGECLDPELLSKALLDLCTLDVNFKETIRRLYDRCPIDQVVGTYIIQSLADMFDELSDKFREAFKGSSEFVICVSHGYLYYSFPDSEVGPKLPYHVNTEVVSNAKVWNGNVQYA